MAKGSKRKSGGRPGRKSQADAKSTSKSRATKTDVGLIDRTAGYYIPVVAFLTGASVMIVELAASRVLSPYFGNTLYTWTALIGVIMVALSGGYYLGGRIADKKPTPQMLLHLVSGAAAFVLLVPLIAESVNVSLAPEGQYVDLLWGPLTAAILLFAVPGVLLGTVTPFAIKLLSMRSENERVGTSAGTISGLSTVGSVLGTFGAGFVLIPSLGIRTIFVVVGVTLAVVAAIGYAGVLGARKRSLPSAALVLIAGLLLAVVAESREETTDNSVIFKADTYYHQIQVKRREIYGGRKITSIYMDRAPEGAQAEEGGDLVYEYTRYYRLERLFCPSMDRAAFLGGGAYSMPQALVNDHPSAVVDVAEIDPMVEEMGRRFFHLDDYEGKIRPFIGDARHFLHGSSDRYDLIFGDAYRGQQNVPSHMVTREFFDLVKRRLTEDGVFMMNLIGALSGSMSRFFAAATATLLEVFPELYVFATMPLFPEETQNLILVAPARQRGFTEEQLLERAGNDERLRRMVQNLVDQESLDLTGATVLTDDYNPVQYIIARQLDESRQPRR